MAERIAVGGHAVARGNGAQGAHVVVRARVAHHAHRLHRQQHREGLPDRVVEPGAANLVEIDRIRPAQDGELFGRYLARHADGETGSGKGMPADQSVGKPELAAERTHLILEQFAQRLEQLQLHPLRESADIVVRLDGDAGSAGKRHRFDDVGVERALGEKLGAADFVRLLVKYIDECGADDLALLLGIADAPQMPKKERPRVALDERNVVVAAKQLHHFLRLAVAQKPVIDENARELIADRLMDQYGGNRGIDPARQPADHPTFADSRTDALDRLTPEGRHRPVAAATCDAMGEILEERAALRGVNDLGVKLNAIKAARVIGDRREGRAVAGGDGAKPRRQRHHPIAVAHPHLLARTLGPQPLEQLAVVDHDDERAAKFAVIGTLDLAAELVAHRLLAVADAEHRHPGAEHPVGRPRRFGAGDRGGSAGKDDRARPEVGEPVLGGVERVNFAIDPVLAQAPGDQLGHLAAEIENQNFIGHGCGRETLESPVGRGE